MLPNRRSSIEEICKESVTYLQSIQGDLEALFSQLSIDYKIKLEAIKESIESNITQDNTEVLELLNKICEATEEISSNPTYVNYREFGEIITEALLLLKSLQSLLASNLPEFHQASYRLLKYYWAIRYVIARFELESIPEFYSNQLLFFNFPDVVFDFIEKLKEGPQPVEILAEVDLDIRLHKGLPLLLSRSPDEITLSLLGEKFFKVHSISDFYFYYLYDFGEEC